MTKDIDYDYYLIIESSNRETLEHLCRLPFADLHDGIDPARRGGYTAVLWNNKVERKQIRAWAARYYPAHLPYGIHITEVTFRGYCHWNK